MLKKRAALFRRRRFNTAGTNTLSSVDDQVDEMPLTSPPATMSPLGRQYFLARSSGLERRCQLRRPDAADHKGLVSNIGTPCCFPLTPKAKRRRLSVQCMPYKPTLQLYASFSG